MSTPRIRPQSSRERPVSGRSNRASTSNPQIERHRPYSANATAVDRSPLTSDSSASSIRRLNEPLLVNRIYLSEKSDMTPRLGSTMLPPSRYPTQYVDKDKDVVRYKRPPICPQSWIDANNHRPLPYSKLSGEVKRNLSETFVDANIGTIQEYRLEFRGKSPRTIKELIVHSDDFGRTFSALEKQKRSVGRGSSSAQLRSCLFEGAAQPIKTISTYDPNILSFHTSRSARDQKLKRLFTSPESNLHNIVDRSHVRGYKHIPEYGNFSALSGHLVKNQGAMLNR